MQYLEFLKCKHISIALIQEIHRNPMAFIDFRIGCVAYSSSVARSKGVAIIFNSQLAVSIDSSGKADAGRLAYIKINSAKICLAIRLVHDPKFSTMVSYILLDLSDYQLIVRGDFNQVCDINLDKSTCVTLTESKEFFRGINTFISDVHVIVPQCHYNPLTRNYTLFFPPGILYNCFSSLELELLLAPLI